MTVRSDGASIVEAPHMLWGLALAASLIGLACSDPPPPAPAPKSTASAPAPDELAPEELPEGTITGFGLPLPRQMELVHLSSTTVRVRGPLVLERVANYVRHRVEASSVVTGPTKTIFEGARVLQPRGKVPEAPTGRDDGTYTLRYEVYSERDATVIDCQRVFRPAVKKGLTEDERWEKYGIRKDGKPVDPNQFE